MLENAEKKLKEQEDLIAILQNQSDTGTPTAVRNFLFKS